MRSLLQLGPRSELAALLAILVVAAGLRLYGMNWDGGFHFHPDERAIVERVEKLRLPSPLSPAALLDPQTSPLNPHWFNYGTFPLYVMRVMAWAGARFDPKLETYDGYYFVGRTMSALFDLVTIFLVYLLGRRLGGRNVGLLGAAFTALAVLHLQLSHFLTVDVALTTLIVASVYFAVRFADGGRTSDAILSGIFLGLGLATKVSIAPLFLCVLVAAGTYWLRGGLDQRLPRRERLERAVNATALAAVAALGAFFVGEPFALLDRDLFLRHVNEQSEMVRRISDLPYTRQYIDTTPYLYHVQQLIIWGLGAPLGVLAWIGGGFSVFAAWRWRDRAHLILLAWWVPYFALTGAFSVKFLRYMLPMTPFLLVAAADVLVWLIGLRAPEPLPEPRREAKPPAFLGALVRSLARALVGGAPPSGARTLEEELIPQTWLVGHEGAHDASPPHAVQGRPVFGASWRADDLKFPPPEGEGEGEGPTGDARGARPRPSALSPALSGCPTGCPLGGVPGAEREIGRYRLGKVFAFEPPTDSVQDRDSHEPLPSEAPLSGEGPRWARQLGLTAIAVVLASTALYAVAYDRIYSQPHPAAQMSQWIAQNVPPDAALAKEHWEEAVPNTGPRRLEELPMYDPDQDPGKINRVIDVLRRAEYVVFYSQRLYATIARLSDRYPISTRYYRSLFDGSLGYELIAVTRASPGLFGISIVDDTFSRPGLPQPFGFDRGSGPAWNWGFADESFTVYDHPTVMLFRRSRPFDDTTVRTVLAAQQVPPEPTRLMLDAPTFAAQRLGGTWSEMFNRLAPANQYPLIAWLLIVALVTLFTLPVGLVLFRALPDRGYLLARGLGVLLLAYVPWILASLKIAPFGRTTIVLSLLGLAGISGLLYWRNQREIGDFFRSRWRLVLTSEALFLLAFFAFCAIRFANPDLWHPARGGEKPMDFAYLNAAIKSTYFPPYDPWFAGGYMNYYYFGFVVVATLIKLSGVIPWYAFNLAVPLLFALSIGAAFSIGHNLVMLFARFARKDVGEASAIMTGIGGAVLFGVAGNIDGAKQLYERLVAIGGAGVASGIPAVQGITAFLAGLAAVVVGGQPLAPFDFWRSSRMMPGQISITEFPYFTFLFADLHAHLIALPFALLAVGLALTLIATARSPLSLWERVRERAHGDAHSASVESNPLSADPSPLPSPGAPPRGYPARRGRLSTAVSLDSLLMHLETTARFRLQNVLLNLFQGVLAPPVLVVLIVLAFVVGALRVTNSWDYPTYLLIGLGAALLAELPMLRRDPSMSLGRLVVAGVVLVGASTLAFQPFHAAYELFYTGVHPAEERTLLSQYLDVHLLFLFLVLSYVALEIVRLYGRSPLLRTARIGITHWDDLPRIQGILSRVGRSQSGSAGTWMVLLLMFLGVEAGLYLIGFQVVAFLLAILALVALVGIPELLRRDGSPVRLFVLMLAGIAFALGMGVDLVTLDGDIQRMNTVFKFYLQAWTLLSIAAAFGGWIVIRRVVGTGRLWPAVSTRRHESPLTVSSSRAAPTREGLEGDWSDFLPLRQGQGERVPAVAGDGVRRSRERDLNVAARNWGGRVWLTGLGVLTVGVLLYPIFATPVRLQDRFLPLPPTFDGAAFMRAAVYQDEKGQIPLRQDEQAIRWLQENVAGSPVILEAPAGPPPHMPLYRWAGRVSIHTGLPTVLGWDWHQTQQRFRYRSEIEVRLKDVATMYQTPDQGSALSLLKKYKVSYIYVGPVERLYYGSAGLAKFDGMVGLALSLAYDQNGVKIYRVLGT